jgi:hypothetical protein
MPGKITHDEGDRISPKQINMLELDITAILIGYGLSSKPARQEAKKFVTTVVSDHPLSFSRKEKNWLK